MLTRTLTTALLGAAALVTVTTGHARSEVMVGGQAMYPNKTIVENAVNSADHTTLVAAVKAAGLVDTLSGSGPFTVFAPTDAAFKKLPAGTVESLVELENKEKLTGVLTYHVVPGRIDAAMLTGMIADEGGRHTATTVNGATLTFIANGPGNVLVEDAGGRFANVSTYDVYQSNGVIHVIDNVLLPQ